MNRAACSAIALILLSGSGAAESGPAQVAARLEWPGGLSARCLVPLGAARLLLRCEAEEAGALRIVAGLDSPPVLVGPLAASGLLREAAGPLGLGPGSSVFQEATCLRFDGSQSGPEDCSVQVTLAPDACTLFWLNPDGGPGVLGLSLDTRGRSSMSMEAVAGISEPGAGSLQEKWFLTGAPSPAGRAVHAASRISVRCSGLEATVSGGMSAAELAPPGWFAMCSASVGRGGAGVDLLAAGASRGYLDLGGRGCPGGMRAGVRFRFVSPVARIRAGYVLSVGLPGFVPGPFLPSEEEVRLVMERRWPVRGGVWEAGLSASNRIETAADGTSDDDPSGTLSAGWCSQRLQAGVAVDVSRDERAAVEISARAPGAAGKGGAGADLRCAWSACEGICLDLSAHARFATGTGEVLVRAGVRGVQPGSAGIVEPWGSVEWLVTDPGISSR